MWNCLYIYNLTNDLTNEKNDKDWWFWGVVTVPWSGVTRSARRAKPERPQVASVGWTTGLWLLLAASGVRPSGRWAGATMTIDPGHCKLIRVTGWIEQRVWSGIIIRVSVALTCMINELLASLSFWSYNPPDLCHMCNNGKSMKKIKRHIGIHFVCADNFKQDMFCFESRKVLDLSYPHKSQRYYLRHPHVPCLPWHERLKMLRQTLT